MNSLHAIKIIFNVFLNIIFRCTPLKPYVMFYNILDDYNDNPRAISEALHVAAPKIKQIWVYDNENAIDHYPTYIKTVKKDSLKYWFWKNRSKILVDNSVGFQTTNREKKYHLLLRKNQSNISTWHGTPLKHLGRDDKWSRTDYSNFYTSTTDMVLGSEYEKKIFEQAFGIHSKYCLCGNPRNDQLLNSSKQQIGKIKDLIGASGKKVVLFAPTYRDNTDNKYEYFNNERIEQLIRAFEDKFGGEWVFAYRFHHFDTAKRLEMKENSNKVINVDDFIDMNELLVSCDALITDYSGSLFDYMLLNRPCFLYIPDYFQYIQDRGLYLKIDELPWEHCYSIDELISKIANYDSMAVRERVDDFLKVTGNTNKGNASIVVCNLIVRRLSNTAGIIK